MLISATNQFHRVSLAAVGERIMNDHSLSEWEFGLLNSFFLWPYTLMMSPGGWLADRVGTWWTLLIVLAGSALFGSLCGLTGWLALGPLAWWWIALARAGMGLTSAPIYPSTSRTVASWFSPGSQALANGLVIAAAPLGMAASFKLMSFMSKSPGLGWQGAFLVLGLGTAGVTVLWTLFGRSRPPAPAARPREVETPRRSNPWSRVARHRGIIALTLSYSTVGYFEYLLFYWLKHYFQNILHLDESQSTNYTTIAQLFMLVFTPLGGWISGLWIRRWGLRRGLPAMAMLSMGLAALFLLAGALATNLQAKVLLLSLALGWIGASEGPFWTAAVLLGGPLGATSAGFVNTGGNLLGAFAPSATPVIAGLVSRLMGAESGDQLLGWTVALIAGSVLCAAGLFLWRSVDLDRPLAEA
jgi:MFS family permease